MTAHRHARPSAVRHRLFAIALSGAMVSVGSTAAAAASPDQPAVEGTHERAAVTHDDHGEDPGFAPGGIDGDALRTRMVEYHRAGSPTSYRPSPQALKVRESAGDNDTTADAQVVRRPTQGQGREVRISGRLTSERVPTRKIAPSREDDGAIPLARTLELRPGTGIAATGRIGDGPHGSQGTGTGDYDYYEVRGRAGEAISVDLDPKGDLVPQLYVYDARGNLLVGGMDLTGTGDVHVHHPVARSGKHYVAVGTFEPDDPFDSASGPAVITEGRYRLDVRRHAAARTDTDTYAVRLRKGDVLGATVRGGAQRLALHDSRGRVVQTSQADAGSIYPASSPLPRGGRATGDHIIEKSGTYYVSIGDGRGAYSATLGVHRHEKRTRQTILVDFSGPTLDTSVFGVSVADPGTRAMTPMRDFLPLWGLSAGDEAAVIEATTRRIEEILREDIKGSHVRVVSSLEEPDAFGKPGVSRVIIGGTVEEAGGTDAFGISESIDPGNFAREETAIVMPERMADDGPRSLTRWLAPSSDRVRAVAQALGNTAGHEVGHFLGNYHTDDHEDPTNVMNTGYLLHFFARGADGIAGTGDDDRIALRNNRYDPFQGFTGIERTPDRTRFALR